MAQNKSLTVSFFGRDVSLNRTLDGIKKNTFATSNVLESASRKSTYLIAGLGAAAVKFAKAAADDEKAAMSLANTLKTVTGASEAQIANVEKFIKKSEIFAAVADDKIRPAFDTLVRATGDVTKSQKMMSGTTVCLSTKHYGMNSIRQVNTLAGSWNLLNAEIKMFLFEFTPDSNLFYSYTCNST